MSNVVKSAEAEGYGSPVVFDFSDVESRAAAIVTGARAEAGRITAAAREEGEKIGRREAEEGRAEGRKVGFEEGRKEGLAEGGREAFEKARAQITEMQDALAAAMTEFSASKDDLFVQAEKDLLELSLLIAKKIVAREIEADDHVTCDNLKRCLEFLSNLKNIKVRVAPSALETVREYLPELVKTVGELNSVEIEADPSVSPGGCLIVAQQGSLDATIETQFAEVETLLFGKSDG